MKKINLIISFVLFLNKAFCQQTENDTIVSQQECRKIVVEFFQLQKREKYCYELVTNLQKENSSMVDILKSKNSLLVSLKFENYNFKEKEILNSIEVKNNIKKNKKKNKIILGLSSLTIIEGFFIYFKFFK